MITSVGVEKVCFSQNGRNFGDRQCLTEAQTSLVGLPNAKFFRSFFPEWVFQHPQAFTLIDFGGLGVNERNGDLSLTMLGCFTALARPALPPNETCK